jgi:membrane protein CcdC involved in cytochrome C biogenesis
MFFLCFSYFEILVFNKYISKQKEIYMKTKKNIFFILSGLKEMIMDYNLQEGENGLKHISLSNIKFKNSIEIHAN